MSSHPRLAVVFLGSCLVGSLVALGAVARQAGLDPQRWFQPTSDDLEILGHMSIVHLDDGQGGTLKTIDITGVSLRVHNGLGATNGYPTDRDSVDADLTRTNGVGNVIVGYNELGNPDGDDRTGSHNLVAGQGNSFSSFGGVVAGQHNAVVAPFATVTGGRRNTASGPWSTVSGGRYNTASGPGAAVSGGGQNEASGIDSSVNGGSRNLAVGFCSTVSGGSLNTALGEYSSVSGGMSGMASGTHAVVCGGYQNEATGYCSLVSAGYRNLASGPFSVVSGGEYNEASGRFATVSGGSQRAATGDDDWRAGSLFEDN